MESTSSPSDRPHVVCVDGYNYVHRSRAANIGGDHDLVYVFFRSLRALVERLNPTRIFFVLEGVPLQRLAAFPEYKANRVEAKELLVEASGVDGAAPARSPFDYEAFKRQLVEIVSALKYLPVTCVRHPRYECDDVIANLVKASSASVPWTVVSNDTDFIQLLNKYDHVKLYDPMRGGRYVERPDVDYVLMKSLVGDGTDNIPGIRGVGQATATKMLKDPELMHKKCVSIPQNKALYERNQQLIRFHDWGEGEELELESGSGARDWESLRRLFDGWKFNSIITGNAWTKFINTFDPLWPS